MKGNFVLASLIAAASLSLVPAVKRPDWLSHVDRFKLEEYMSVAKERHNTAVKVGLKDYDVGSPTTLSEEELAYEETLRENLKLKMYSINAPGRVPDFR